ncbi:hypothetical protein GCM10025868_43040 [Angustibacter aerolatus]|uniref:CobB/CobQ-like glutamine amidotransferase domain-containing protein n=1 Tax=Angustibacter aerolatus TaxID=1162965 RepID=A0ABQ6JMC5_9ACTN|nr:hypothetical protein [Angustibacter aerolatus]GMA89054.1 hypothetical protein GCM10025868_43040 [Angustibacter aerolatus]
MVGAVPGRAAMSGRLTLGYRVARTPAGAPGLVSAPGEPVAGHEFHRTTVEPGHGGLVDGWHAGWTFDDLGYGGRTEGFARAALHAAYLHVHWAGQPQAAERLIAAARSARAAAARREVTEPAGA